MKERRKILLVNAVQQRRLIMGSLLGGILLINALALFLVMFNPALLAFIELSQTLALAGLEMVIVAAIAYFSLILSHRIVGPAYALSRDLQRLGGGDLTVRTRLRKGDFHTEVAEAFNLSAETLCSKVKTLKAALTILQQQADTPDATRQALTALLNDLAYFKTEAAFTQDPTQADEARNRVMVEADRPSSLAR